MAIAGWILYLSLNHADVVLGLVVGVDLIVGGLSLAAMALTLRRVATAA